jgi:DNA-binding NarL/FixJ family response regulator
MRIFLLDDSPILRKEISNMLSDMTNLQVDIVGEAGEIKGAEKIISDLRPDVAIIDIQVHDGNGIDVLREVKFKVPGLKVIMLTNFPSFQHRIKCLSLGADHCLDKHYDIDKIPLKTLLSGRAWD